MLIHLAAFVVVIAGIISAKSLIVPFLLAAFLAIICGPPLYWLRTKGIPPFVSVIILVLVLIAIEVILAGLIGSSIGDFTRNLPFYQARLKEMLGGVIAWMQVHGLELTEEIIMEQFDPGKIMGLAANTLNIMGGWLTNTFMIILTLVFILLEATGFPDKLKAVAHDEKSSFNEYGQIVRGVNKYMLLKTATSLFTGVMVAVVLEIIGVDFAVMWGLVAFLLNFVPTVGSIIAAIPSVLLALVQLGPGPAMTVAGSYLVINVLIGNILEPRIMGSGIGLSPMVIWMTMAFWGWVLGPVGMLLSVPLTMTLKIALHTNENTRWISLLLGSNADARAALQHKIPGG
ncbi:MAG: AI-2E family transporter [Desulfobulbaceae bacterium]|nr:AI-2E family transporter [Desulfobulbaceae bacterium]